MIAPARALWLVLSHCSAQPVEQVALDEALGRVAGRAVRADRDMPPADRSTMDGYAVRANDLRSVPRELKMIGEVAAGSGARPRVGPGECVRILTGANVPPGADAVAMVESTEEVSPKVIRFCAKVAPGENILCRGSVARRGQVVLDKGTRLHPQQIAVCASVGADPVSVFARPRVGVLCTGQELVSGSGRAARPAQRDSNGPALRAALLATGLARCEVLGVVEDDPKALRRVLRAALRDCDALLTVGGVSAGKYDFVPRALTELGCREVFHGVAMKPGKPTLFALGPKGQLVFGLPGNPLSALTAFHEFVAPALRKMSGMTAPPPTRFLVRLCKRAVSDCADRTLFMPAQLLFDPSDGAPTAIPIEMRGSADVVAGGQCDGVVVLPEARTYKAGSVVEFHLWSPMA